MLNYEKHFVKVSDKDNLCIHRFYKNVTGTPVFMLHGAIENGRIFYSLNQKGLGPFLARAGYDVYIVDMRGKGDSTPKISKKLTYSQKELITNDIPKCLDYIKDLTHRTAFHFIGHSWGGVWLYCFLARLNKKYSVLSQVLYASKRRISVKTLKRLIHIDLIWNLGGEFSTKLVGYAKFNRKVVGIEYEPGNLFKDVNRWVYSKDWKSPDDNFDYTKELKKINLPPTLHLAGIKDKILGNPIDVKHLINEAGEHQEVEFTILGKQFGNLRDYGHNDILTHKLAEEDSFKLTLEWLKKHESIEQNQFLGN